MQTFCANCNKKIDRPRTRIKERNYCNSSCQMKYEYKHGIRDKSTIALKAQEAVRIASLKKFKLNPTRNLSKRGYWVIYIPGKGFKKEHHYFWEKVNGPIPKGKVIHHKNLNPQDNRLSNLEIMDKKDHAKLHYALRIIEKSGRFSAIRKV